MSSISVEGRIAETQRLRKGVIVALELLRLKGTVCCRRLMLKVRGFAYQGRAVLHVSTTLVLANRRYRRPTPASSFSSVASYHLLHAMRNSDRA